MAYSVKWTKRGHTSEWPSRWTCWQLVLLSTRCQCRSWDSSKSPPVHQGVTCWGHKTSPKVFPSQCGGLRQVKSLEHFHTWEKHAKREIGMGTYILRIQIRHCNHFLELSPTGWQDLWKLGQLEWQGSTLFNTDTKLVQKVQDSGFCHKSFSKASPSGKKNSHSNKTKRNQLGKPLQATATGLEESNPPNTLGLDNNLTDYRGRYLEIGKKKRRGRRMWL